ncbi:GPW/gp25 family protein [Hydrogenophaga sp.]|uniref:GPW/gp25 family protein n=1 Tax=Hydrogenophaga sp. TaxID=1904254 RepID=UPI003F704D11
MSRTTGQPLHGMAHLQQSIADILRTPIGTRLMRRSYGSLLPQLIDQPDNPATRVRVYAATAGALMRWEPRLRLSRVRWQASTRPGQVLLQIEGVYTPQGRAAQPVNLPIELGATA